LEERGGITTILVKAVGALVLIYPPVGANRDALSIGGKQNPLRQCSVVHATRAQLE
jgi:hypothetical protein